MCLQFLQKIKQSTWNKPMVKNPLLDRLLNALFWIIFVAGTVGVALIFYILNLIS
jgi:hypothetical protein